MIKKGIDLVIPSPSRWVNRDYDQDPPMACDACSWRGRKIRICVFCKFRAATREEFLNDRKMINYEKEHRKMWNWLADHPDKEKKDYFENWDATSIPMSRCFACEASYQRVGRMCKSCPLGGQRVVGCTDGLYAVWRCERDPEKRRQLARKIAELPWKEKKR